MDPLTTPFGFHTTADEIVVGVDLSGKRAIVTGATSGIGVETARSLARAGAEVTVAVRRPDVAAGVIADMKRTTGNDRIAAKLLDLADQGSVRDFVTRWDGPLHILVNNAGIMALPTCERTSAGWEMQFATNFVGHFALTIGLHDALVAARGARVVSSSSSANMFSPVNFDDVHFNFLPYDPWVAYGQSKTACALLAVEATRRWSSERIFANALNPGAIATNLQQHTGGLKTPVERRKTPQQGAATSVLLAASPLVEGIGGRYFEDCNESHPVARRPTDFSGGYAPYALSPVNAERIWELALELIGSKP
jgi:NAD(P)-dependent dehydrogenase (short-subunit alcohol dehydrogenase family)